MPRKVGSLGRPESGNDVIEYALITLFICIIMIAVIGEVGPLVVAVCEAIRDALQG